MEQETCLQTDEALVAQFGAPSTDAVVVSGRWMSQSTRYDDNLILYLTREATEQLTRSPVLEYWGHIFNQYASFQWLNRRCD
jgi:hypothetical protein